MSPDEYPHDPLGRSPAESSRIGVVEFTLEWAPGDPGRRIDGPEGLDRLLDEAEEAARASEPLIATLGGDDGRSLSIGLGRKRVSLTSTSRDGMPPYFTSDNGSADETPIVYFLVGHWTEFPAWSAISAQQGREAMHHFLATGELHPGLGWREI